MAAESDHQTVPANILVVNLIITTMSAYNYRAWSNFSHLIQKWFIFIAIRERQLCVGSCVLYVCSLLFYFYYENKRSRIDKLIKMFLTYGCTIIYMKTKDIHTYMNMKM